MIVKKNKLSEEPEYCVIEYKVWKLQKLNQIEI